MRFDILSYVLPTLLAALALVWAPQQSQAEEQQARAITVVANDGSFAPSQIQAQPGETLRVTVTNQGKLPHSIVFVLPDGNVGLQGNVDPGGSASMDLTVPTDAGQYAFYCPVDNHRAMGMEGQLVVRQPQ